MRRKLRFEAGIPLLIALLAPPQGVRALSGEESDAIRLAEGRRVYRAACLPCHGERGDGNSPAARFLSPRPRDFTVGTFKFRSTPTGAPPTDQDLFRTITQGIPGTMMPAWGEILSEEERWAVIAYLKTFSEVFAEPEPPVAIPAPPPPSEELATEGRMVYMVLKCWQCHGMVGRGDGPSAGELHDDWGARIRPYDFTRGDYKGGRHPTDIFRTFRTGLAGTPMPAFEPQVFLYGGSPEPDLTPYEDGLIAEELGTLRSYLRRIPGEAELTAMSPAEQDSLFLHRAWALVHYVRALSRGKGLFYRLFAEDTELTHPGAEP